MNAEVRRKLDMADRVRDFNRAHPSEDAAYASMFARLEDRVTRANVLATQQRAGRIAEGAGSARRRELRRSLHTGLLRLLVRVGEIAAKEKPDLAKRFQLPPQGFTSRAFITAARAMLAEAQVNKELFLQLGMPDTLLGELGKMLDQYAEAMEQTTAGRRDHVGARADLKAVTLELLELVGVVDGLNRYRFRSDPEQLAAWESAKNVVARHRNGTAQTPGGGTGQVPPSPTADGGLQAA